MPEELSRLYEDLANHFARQGESRRRDECWVLAADAALSEGRPEEAERLRKRLLLMNPHHLLRPFASMEQAMQSSDVRDYVADLRNELPPETVAKMVNRSAGTNSMDTLRQAIVKPKPAAAPKAKTKSVSEDETVTPFSYGLALLLFALGLALAGALAFASLGVAFWE